MFARFAFEKQKEKIKNKTVKEKGKYSDCMGKQYNTRSCRLNAVNITNEDLSFHTSGLNSKALY